MRTPPLEKQVPSNHSGKHCRVFWLWLSHQVGMSIIIHFLGMQYFCAIETISKPWAKKTNQFYHGLCETNIENTHIFLRVSKTVPGTQKKPPSQILMILQPRLLRLQGTWVCQRRSCERPSCNWRPGDQLDFFDHRACTGNMWLPMMFAVS